MHFMVVFVYCGGWVSRCLRCFTVTCVRICKCSLSVIRSCFYCSDAKRFNALATQWAKEKMIFKWSHNNATATTTTAAAQTYLAIGSHNEAIVNESYWIIFEKAGQFYTDRIECIYSITSTGIFWNVCPSHFSLLVFINLWCK